MVSKKHRFTIAEKIENPKIAAQIGEIKKIGEIHNNPHENKPKPQGILSVN
jgi:hypothetical protein